MYQRHDFDLIQQYAIDDAMRACMHLPNIQIRRFMHWMSGIRMT